MQNRLSILAAHWLSVAMPCIVYCALIILKYICRQELPFSSSELRQYKIGKVGKQIFVTSNDVFRETGQGAFS